jgi:hypothetical protein
MTRLLLCREDLAELIGLLKSNAALQLSRPSDWFGCEYDYPECDSCDYPIVGRLWYREGGPTGGGDYNDDTSYCEHCAVREAIANAEFDYDPEKDWAWCTGDRSTIDHTPKIVLDT